MKYINDEGHLKDMSIDPYSDNGADFLLATRRLLISASEVMSSKPAERKMIQEIIDDFLENNPFMNVKQ